MPGLFPDYPAPVIRNTDTGTEIATMRWGMPPPARTGGPPVTNIRNMSSPHWRMWLKPENRCLVPANSFAEYAPEPNTETSRFLCSLTLHLCLGFLLFNSGCPLCQRKQEAAEQARRLAEDPSRRKQEQLREQARLEREVADKARELAEREEPKIAEATKEAEEERPALDCTKARAALWPLYFAVCPRLLRRLGRERRILGTLFQCQ